MTKPLLSFVIPCYRSALTIGDVVRELTETLKTRESEYDYELILVNDGSPDDTAGVLGELCKQNERIVFVNLSRNFGQHSALMAGFHQVRGEVVICLDDDGQTPADECFKLIDKVYEGNDIVYADYGKTRQTAFRRMGSRFNSACNHFFFNQPKALNVSSYFACRRFVIDTALQYPNPFPYITGLMFESASTYANVPVKHRAREEGRSGYTLKKLISLWANGVTAFSIKPLRLASYVGWGLSVVGFVFAVVTVVRKLVNPTMQAGWASTIAILLLMGAVIIALSGLVGENIGRIYLSINRYPQFVVRSVTRGGADETPRFPKEAEHENASRNVGA